MVRIELIAEIEAPIDRCFDLSRSIDLHMASSDWTAERAVAGVTCGLIGAGQQVSWKGRHFGFVISHTSQITAFDCPHYFQDSMIRGRFKRFCHDHYFEARTGGTRMRDCMEMELEAPWGFVGRLAEGVLETHMRSLLERRNRSIKAAAESDEWRKYLRVLEADIPNLAQT